MWLGVLKQEADTSIRSVSPKSQNGLKLSAVSREDSTATKGHWPWFSHVFPIFGILLLGPVFGAISIPRGTGTDLPTAAKACGIRHAATLATLGKWPPGLLGLWRLLNLGTHRRLGWLKEDFSCFREGRSKEESAQRKEKMLKDQRMGKLWREKKKCSKFKEWESCADQWAAERGGPKERKLKRQLRREATNRRKFREVAQQVIQARGRGER